MKNIACLGAALGSVCSVSRGSRAAAAVWEQRCCADAELQSVCCSPSAASASFGFLQEMNTSLNFFFFFQ